jgi:hypothetical protein
METIKIKGLARLTAAIFAGWGGLVAIKGLWDLFIGQPEANAYAPYPWAFVTQADWMRWSGFELAYGLACLGLSWVCLRYARRLPDTIQRRRQEAEFSLFD